jgi:hypothetical protein
MHVSVLDFMIVSSVHELGAQKCSARIRSGSALKISLRLWQPCFLLHGVEERENDILIPSDKHNLYEQMRRHDGFSWVGPIDLEEQSELCLQREVARASGSPKRHELSACHRSEVNREMSLKVLNVSKVRRFLFP